MSQLREAKVELLEDGVYLKWASGETAGPFASFALAEQFLDWCENQQRAQQRTKDSSHPSEESGLGRSCTI